LASENGVGADQIARALGGFRGLKRRFELLGTWGGVLVIDDYAHHPTAVSATLATVRRMAPGRRVWCVFQPHQASRTACLLDELAGSLQNADIVLVGEIFRAREGPPRPGDVTAADLRERVREGPAVLSGIRSMAPLEVPPAETTEEIVGLLESRLSPGDVLITMGAGDIRKVCDGIIGRFREDRAAG
jgi:UDP-N-acetylmuramate--alanine ligase